MTKKKKQAEPLLTCPKCGSDQVTTEHHQMFMVNTSEPYCHSMKTQDDESPATCLTCRWKGLRKDLKGQQP